MMPVETIVTLLGPLPDTAQQDIPLTQELFREIVRIYHEVYALGLTSFFENPWFHHRDVKGNLSFPNDSGALSTFTSFLKAIEKAAPNDRASMLSSGVLEAKLIWSLAKIPFQLCPQTRNNMHNASTVPHPADGTEARNRVFVFETLLNGGALGSNPLALVSPETGLEQSRMREFWFWHALGDFVSLRDASGQSLDSRRDEILTRMRQLLDGRENRDILYSLAVVRQLAPRYPPGFEQTIPAHLDENDPKNKLYVASEFIKREAQVTGGTTNVVRRFCETAIQAYIQPGVNVQQRPSPAP